MAVGEINLNAGSYNPFDDTAEKYANKIVDEVLDCKPSSGKVTKYETPDIVKYCQIADAKYTAVTYGLIFKSENAR